jgi:hypothetical protein
MGSASDELREKLQAPFSAYKFRDERCGMCSVDADANLLAKRLARYKVPGTLYWHLVLAPCTDSKTHGFAPKQDPPTQLAAAY